MKISETFRQLESISHGLDIAKANNASLLTWQEGPDGRRKVQVDGELIGMAITSLRMLRETLKNIPIRCDCDNREAPTSCYCATTHPPCGFCTDPKNDPENA